MSRPCVSRTSLFPFHVELDHGEEEDDDAEQSGPELWIYPQRRENVIDFRINEGKGNEPDRCAEKRKIK
jgi:hypothetical protein